MSIKRKEDCKMQNAHVLHFTSCRNGSASHAAVDAAERFLKSASVLPPGGSLTLLIKALPNNNSTAFVLSDPETNVTAQDIDWIFSGCAETAVSDTSVLDDLFSDGNRIYSVLSDPEHTQDQFTYSSTYYFGDYDDSICSSSFREMFTMLEQEGAVIRIDARASDRSDTGTGIFLISLPGEMTLRLRSAIALALPGTHIEDADNVCGTDLKDRFLFNPSLLHFIESLLYLLTTRQEKEINAIQETDQFTEIPEEETPDIQITYETGTPIDQLGLSIRSYNCLMRAGVNTIEQLMDLDDSELKAVRNLGKKNIEEIRSKLRHVSCVRTGTFSEYPDPQAMLDSLIGLESVKTQIRKITAYARMKQSMLASGKNCSPLSLNMEFVGNPGTAKTTVARITAGILHDAGILSHDDMIEVGRSDLIARYEGQTASKVKDVFLDAKGKVLFIDEAYSLLEDHQGEFGDEAINTIVQEIENSRGDTVVIFAGYPDKMEAFFSRNPGLRSRVPFRIEFGDYSAGELVNIAEQEAEKHGFSISQDAGDRLTGLCSEAAGHPELGNGRFSRNIIENAVLNYALRLFSKNTDDVTGDFILTAEDLDFPSIGCSPERTTIGF